MHLLLRTNAFSEKKNFLPRTTIHLLALRSSMAPKTKPTASTSRATVAEAERDAQEGVFRGKDAPLVWVPPLNMFIETLRTFNTRSCLILGHCP